MSNIDPYQTLEISPEASQKEIKQAYRRLAKLFHPDTNHHLGDAKKIIAINAAYEILSDPQSRRLYNQKLEYGDVYQASTTRQQRTTQAQKNYQAARKDLRVNDVEEQEWIKRVYQPITRLLNKIINPLRSQIEELSADPYDDELMTAFGDYLEDCWHHFERTQTIFTSLANPPQLASTAANIYYCLNHINDGLKELEWFTNNYDDRHLHTGKELFTMAKRLLKEVKDALATTKKY